MIGRLLRFVVCGTLLMNLYGCGLLLAGAVGGAGTAAWLSGKLSDELAASYERSITATKKAIAALDMTVTKETNAEGVTQIRSNYIDGSDVWIDLRPLTDKSTKIEIRVGVIGDKTASTKILNEIKKHL